jgi:hypothetical protein
LRCGLESVEELRNLIRSSALYKNDAVTNEHIEYRKTNFDEFCEIVAKDGENYEADASRRRIGRDLNGDAAEVTRAPINPKFY